MDYKEITTKSEAELKKLLGELREQVHGMSVKVRMNEEKQSHKLGILKKDIARILTHLRTLEK